MDHPISFNQKQYLTLVKALHLAYSMYGIMGDMVDKKFKKTSLQIEELNDIVLLHADKFGMEGMVEEFMGKNHLADGKSEEFMDDLLLYEDFSMWDNLAHNLAERDMVRLYSIDQIEQMDKFRYIELAMILEEEYHQEFEKFGLARIGVKKLENNEYN